MRNVRRGLSRTGSLLSFLILLGANQPAWTQEQPVIFSATGDVPYGSSEVSIFQQQMLNHNKYSPSAFLVHVGDILSGGSACNESVYSQVSSLMKTLTVPAYIAAGDNETVDCKAPAQGMNYFLKYFNNFEQNFCGAPYTERQSGRPENWAFTMNGVLFVGINLAYGGSTAQQQAADWVKQQLETKASTVRAAAVFAHYSPGNFSTFSTPFRQAVAAFAKPVLFLHGHGHSWSTSYPFPEKNILRVQVDNGGAEDPVEVTVTMDNSSPAAAFVFKRNPWSGKNIVNMPPCVIAGADQTIDLTTTATLQGGATDDGDPVGALTTTWSLASGPGTVTFGNPNSLATTASFSAPGTYVLRLTADDTQLQASDDVTITVPAVNPALAINDVTLDEGHFGATEAVFTVSLAAGDGSTVAVDYEIVDGTATNGEDYAASPTSGTLTFPDGTTTQMITVTIYGDQIDEQQDETFFVNLSNSINADILDGQGLGTMLNDDVPIPPNAPNQLFARTTGAATVDLSCADQSNDEEGFKLERKNGSGDFAEIATLGPNANFYQDAGLSSSTVYSYRVRAFKGTAYSDYSNTSATETASGVVANPNVNLALNQPASASSTYNSYTAANAVDGNISSYWRSGGLSLNAAVWLRVDLGKVQAVGRAVIMWKDTYFAKSYELQVSNNDVDWTPVYSTSAGAGGNETLLFTPALARYLRLYMTANNKSTERITELQVYSGPLSAPPQAPASLAATATGSATIALTWNDNSTDETGFAIERASNGGGPAVGFAQIATTGANVTSYDDTGLNSGTTYVYRLRAFNAAGNSSYSNEAVATTPFSGPTLSINDVTLNEGHDGATEAVFTVTLAAADGSTVTVDYQTADGTAKAGSDYVAAAGTLTFPAGTTTQTLAVVVNGDTEEEPDESFFVNLVNPAHATIGDGQGVGTIKTDELSSIGLVGHWKFDEGSGTSTADASGNGNNGTLQNGLTWTTGQVGGALRFDGTNDLVLVPDAASLKPTSTLSVFLWINKESSDTAIRTAIAKENASNRGWLIYHENTDKLTCGIDTDNNQRYDADELLTSTNTVSRGGWHHVGFTFNRGVLTVYVDGLANGAKTLTETNVPSDLDALQIGIRGDGRTQPWFGLLDEVRIYNRVLSDAEIAALAQLDATPPSAPVGLTATASGENVNLFWTAASDAESGISGYKIYRGTSSGGENFLIQVGNVTSYTDGSTSPNTTYFYQVSAVNGAGMEGLRSDEASAITGNNPPAAPAGLSASAGNQQISLNWNDNSESDLAGYHVYRSTTAGGPYTRITTSLVSVSAYNDAGLTNGITYYYAVTATDADNNESANSNEANATPTDSDPTLVGYWKFDEGSGTVAADASGNGNHGTLQNGPIWTTGRIGGALRFDGNNDYVNLPSGLLNGLSNVTTAFWIKTSKTGKQAIFSGATSGNNEEYLLYFTSHTQILFFLGESPSSYVAWTITSIANGQWHHVAVVRDDTNNMVTLYIDGVSQGAKAATLNPLSIVANGLVIGQEQDAVGGGFDPVQAFAGDLDDVRIYNRALSAAEIQALASGTLSKDSNAEPEANSLENSLPQRFYLAQNYPNPFPPPGRGTFGNPATVIRYELPAPVHVKLAVYDIVGRKVRTLVEAVEPAGFRQIAWDGANEAGVRVTSGTYLVHIEAGAYRMARKITLMK